MNDENPTSEPQEHAKSSACELYPAKLSPTLRGVFDRLPEKAQKEVIDLPRSFEGILQAFLVWTTAPSISDDVQPLPAGLSGERLSRLSREVLEAVKESGDEELTSVLAAAFQQTEVVQEQAMICQVIGLIRAKNGLNFLRLHLFNDEPAIQIGAIEATALYNDRSQFSLYRTLYIEGRDGVKEAALEAIQYLQQLVSPTLITLKNAVGQDAILIREDLLSTWSPFSEIPANADGDFAIRIPGILQDFMLQPALDEARRMRRGGFIIRAGEHNTFTVRSDDFSTLLEMEGSTDAVVVRALETNEVSEVYAAMQDLDDATLLEISLHSPNDVVSTGALAILMMRDASLDRVRSLFQNPYPRSHRLKILFEFRLRACRDWDHLHSPEMQSALSGLLDQEAYPEVRAAISDMVVNPEAKLERLVRFAKEEKRPEPFIDAIDLDAIMDGVMALNDTTLKRRIIASIESAGKFGEILGKRDAAFVRRFYAELAQQPSFIAIIKDYGVPRDAQEIALEFMTEKTLLRALDAEEISFEVRHRGGILLGGMKCGRVFRDLDDLLEHCDSIKTIRAVGFYCRESDRVEYRIQQIEARRLEEEKRARIEHEKAVVGARRQGGLCIHCGEQMSWFQRISGKVHHAHCRHFHE